MQCRASKTLTSTAFPLAPYLLRELMNFSLARLLTSFKVPSSGLLHLLTPVAGVCFPRKETDGRFLCSGSRIGISTASRGQSKRAKGTIYSISGKTISVSSCTESTDSTRKLFFQKWTAEPSHFQAKLHFITSFTFKKGKLKVKFTLFGKYFQSKIRFQDKNIHKPIFSLPSTLTPTSPHLSIKKKRSQALLFLIKTRKSHSRHRTSTAPNSSHYSSYGKNRNP